MPSTLYHFKKRAALLAAVAALVLLAIVLGIGRSSGRVAYMTAPVQRGSITASVEATGTINPLTTVPVGSYVSGTVKYIFADFNTRVRAGQVLAQIDPAVYEAQVATARGNLLSAQATAAKMEADLAYARASAQRSAALYAQGLTSVDQRDLSRSTLAQAEASARIAEAQVDAMGGALRQAEANLRYTTILSPMDGTVVARNIAVGQSVAASLQAPNLFTIAQDLTRMQVYAKTDESDTGFIKPGATATFEVDAFPNEIFRGRVSAIRLNASIVQNVVTYDTVIDFDNTDEKLLPGETAYVTIPTGHAADALLLPNAALTFTPDLPAPRLEELYRRSDIPAAVRKSHTGSEQIVWKLESGRELEPVAVKVGISNFTRTQLVEGKLQEGDLLVTAAAAPGSSGTSKGTPGAARPTRRG
jgi:HlyD family secretion protein